MRQGHAKLFQVKKSKKYFKRQNKICIAEKFFEIDQLAAPSKISVLITFIFKSETTIYSCEIIMKDQSHSSYSDKDEDKDNYLEEEESEETVVTPFGVEFLNKYELVTAVQVYAKQQGFVLPIKWSRDRTIELQCN